MELDLRTALVVVLVVVAVVVVVVVDLEDVAFVDILSSLRWRAEGGKDNNQAWRQTDLNIELSHSPRSPSMEELRLTRGAEEAGNGRTESSATRDADARTRAVLHVFAASSQVPATRSCAKRTRYTMSTVSYNMFM